MSKTAKRRSRHSLLLDFLEEAPAAVEQCFAWGVPIEINSGTIAVTDADSHLLEVQANTAQGLWALHGVLQSHVGTEELRDFLDDVKQRHRVPPFRWKNRSPSILLPPREPTPSLGVAESPTAEDDDSVEHVVADDWRSSPSDLLTKLSDPSIKRTELFDSVLFSEIAEFNEPQTRELVSRLFVFVSDYRFSHVDEAKTAVGAAIRKLAMNLKDPQVEEYADLFLPTDTETLPCEIELELAKAIVWRLANSPASLMQAFPTLENRLAELALDYMKPRLVLQKNYASTALQAAIGVSLLRGEHSRQVVEAILSLGIGWFSDLFKRRLDRMRRELEASGDECRVSIAADLERLASLVEVPEN